MTSSDRLWGATPSALVLFLIVVTFAIRLVAASTMGFSFDEAYVVVMSRQPDFGYFDHPPLTMWLVAAMRWLTGSDGALVARLPTLLLFAGTTWIIYRLGARLFDPWAGLIAAAALNLAPLFGVYIATIVVTDGPMLFGVALGAACLTRAIDASDRTDWPAWIGAGLGFGLALLAKYIPVLLAPGLILFFIASREHRRWFLHPAPYVALLIVLAFLAPSVWWNIAHDWPSLRFHGPRAAPDTTIHPLRAATHLAILAIIVLPGIWFGLVWSTGKTIAAGFRRPAHWLLAAMAAGPIVLFPLITMFGAVETRAHHWVASGYLLAFPLLGGLVLTVGERMRWWVKWSSVSSAVLIVALLIGFVAHFRTGWIRAVLPPDETYDPLVSDQTDWWDLLPFLAERGLDDPERYFLIGDSLETCSKIGVVAGDLLPLVCHTRNPIALAMADSGDFIGRDGIYVTRLVAGDRPEARIADAFARTETLGKLTMTQYGFALVDTQVIVGRDLQKALPRP